MILEDVRNGNTMVSRTENGIVGSCRIWPLSMPVRVGGGPLGNFLTTAAAQRGNNLQAHGGSEPRFVTFLSWTVNGYSGRVLVRASTAYRKRKRERERDFVSLVWRRRRWLEFRNSSAKFHSPPSVSCVPGSFVFRHGRRFSLLSAPRVTELCWRTRKKNSPARFYFSRSR